MRQEAFRDALRQVEYLNVPTRRGGRRGMQKTFIGIDVGKTNLRVGLTTDTPELKCYSKRTYQRGLPADVDRQILCVVDEALNKAGASVDSLAGIGIGVPAIVNREDGTILYGPDYEFLEGHSITKSLKEHYGVPLTADVDTVVASWGEQWVGMGRVCNRFGLVTWGTSLGAGLILDGKVYEGPDNLFAEFGHSIVSDDDWPCICGGRGCVATLASASGIVEHGRRAIAEGKHTLLGNLADFTPANVTCSMVFDAASRGDAIAIEILERVAILLGRLCANLVYTIQPEKIVIVGGLAERAHSILELMNRTMRQHCWLIFKGFTSCEILPSDLGDTAGVLGAIRMVQQRQNSQRV
jgi:glucokinase